MKKNIMSAAEVLALGIKQVPMLIENLLQKIGIASLSGSSDGGKSYLLLFIAALICGDFEKLFGRKVDKKHGSVIVVCTEDTAEDICVRLSGLLEDKKINESYLRFVFDSTNLIQTLSDELGKQPADLVIFDTLGDLFVGNINDSIAVRKFIKPYRELAHKYECLFLFNHHIGKGKENNNAPSKNDVLGSQGIESACRTVLMLKKVSQNKRILTIVKGNHIAEKFKSKGMVLDFDPVKGFMPTNETIAYSSGEASSDDREKKATIETEVLDLYPKLNSYQKVASTLRAKGFTIDKNKVGLIWKKYHPSVPPSTENDGRTPVQVLS